MNNNECSYEGCERQTLVRGLCRSHYEMWLRGQELRPIATYKRYARPAPGKKICTACEAIKDIKTEFYERSPGSPTNRCKDCMRESEARRRKERNEDEVRLNVD